MLRSIAALATAAAGVMMATAATPVTPMDWPMSRGSSQHTLVNSAENTLTPATVGALAVQWSRSVGQSGVSSSVQAPAVVGDAVYTGGRAVSRRDRVSGAVVWTRQVDPGSGVGVNTTPAYADGRVVAVNGGNVGTVVSLDAGTGAVGWRRTLVGGVSTSPTVAGGIVYVSVERISPTPARSGVVALRATDGHPLWTWLGPHEFGTISSRTTDGTTVYVGVDGASRVVALDAHTGAVRWTRSIGSQQTGSTDGFGVALVGGTVFASSAEGHVRALDAVTGAVKWAVQASGPVYGGVAVTGSAVLLATSGDSGVVEARSPSSGALLWSTTVSGHCCMVQAPTVAAGVAYVTTLGQSAAHDLSALVALDLATGAELRRVDLPTHLDLSLVTVSQGHLYLGYGGTMVAMGLP